MSKIESRIRRKKRVRSKVYGTPDRLRMSVYKSNSHIFVQLIDDEKGMTVVAGSDTEIKEKGKMTEKALAVGELLAKKAIAKKMKKVVFDKNGYKYHGVIKAVADGARKGGLEF